MSKTKTFRERIYPSYTSIYTPSALDADVGQLENNSRAILSRLADWLPSNKATPILDVACGAGGLLFALRSAGYSDLHGVDCSAQQVNVARQFCDNVQIGDAIAFLQLCQGRFGLITAFDIIEHFDKEDVFPFLDALYAALQPGGRLIVQTPNADSPWFGSVRYGDFTHEIAFTPESLTRVMKIAGFENMSMRECAPFNHGFKSGVRTLLWFALRHFLIAWNLIEIGSRGSLVFTRVFIAKADKPL